MFAFSILLSFQIIHPKTDDQRNRLQEACKDILLFKNLDPVREIIIIEVGHELGKDLSPPLSTRGSLGDHGRSRVVTCACWLESVDVLC